MRIWSLGGADGTGGVRSWMIVSPLQRRCCAQRCDLGQSNTATPSQCSIPVGDVGAHGAGEEGIYHEDTRYLSRLEMRVGDSRPSLLSSAIDDDGVLNVDLTNPGLYVDDRLVTPKDSVHIHRSKVLWRGACYEKLDIHSKFRPSDA